jgi:hypothetical protein
MLNLILNLYIGLLGVFEGHNTNIDSTDKPKHSKKHVEDFHDTSFPPKIHLFSFMYGNIAHNALCASLIILSVAFFIPVR